MLADVCGCTFPTHRGWTRGRRDNIIRAPFVAKRVTYYYGYNPWEGAETLTLSWNEVSEQVLRVFPAYDLKQKIRIDVPEAIILITIQEVSVTTPARYSLEMETFGTLHQKAYANTYGRMAGTTKKQLFKNFKYAAKHFCWNDITIEGNIPGCEKRSDAVMRMFKMGTSALTVPLVWKTILWLNDRRSWKFMTGLLGSVNNCSVNPVLDDAHDELQKYRQSGRKLLKMSNRAEY